MPSNLPKREAAKEDKPLTRAAIGRGKFDAPTPVV